MIHIDIYVPVLDQSFELRCDENVPLHAISKSIYEMLMRKNGEEPSMEKSGHAGFWFCDPRNNRILSPDKSLREQNIIHGNTLMFL